MINLKYKKCSVSISGDYYQIMFDDDLDEPDNYDDIDEVMNSIDRYFLVQFNFEFPGKECYFESEDENLIGHYIVNSVVIGHRSFAIKYGPNDKFTVTIEYDATDEEQTELINVSKKMFANVKVDI